MLGCARFGGEWFGDACQAAGVPGRGSASDAASSRGATLDRSGGSGSVVDRGGTRGTVSEESA